MLLLDRSTSRLTPFALPDEVNQGKVMSMLRLDDGDAAHTGRQPHTIVRLLVDGRKLLSGETEEQGALRSAYHQAIRQGLDGSHKLAFNKGVRPE